MYDRSYLLLLLLMLVVLACCGCGISGVTSTTSQGDSVTNQGGLGTGTVAGVNITVQGLKQKNAAVIHSVHIAQGIESSTESHRWEVEFGEIKLVLASNDDQPISLTINGENYGTVDKGDELEIAANRAVIINGEERKSQAP